MAIEGGASSAREPTPLPGSAHITPATAVNSRVRKEVLDELARNLESRYAVVDMGKKLAEGFPDRALIYLNGNRYRPEGLADGFVISFRMNQGKPELLMEEPVGSPIIRAKQ